MTDHETHPAPAARGRLQRSRSDRVLGGVCGGIARSTGLDTSLVRIGAVVLALLSGGAATLVYLAAWILLPPAVGEPVPLPAERRPTVGDGAARDAWTAAGGELRTLATGLRTPRPVAPDTEAQRQEERSRTAAVDRAMTSLGDRLRDPEVRAGARRAAAGVSTAVGASVEEIGRRARRNGTPPAAGTQAPGTPVAVTPAAVKPAAGTSAAGTSAAGTPDTGSRRETT